jgi:RNA polymerase sigma factor (sigma-70 family)
VSKQGDIEREIPFLRRYAYALTRNADDADDLVHDCVARALSRWHLRRADGSVRAWLYRILTNLFLSDRRRASRRRTVVLDVEGAEQAVVAPQEVQMELAQVLDAIGRLSEDRRAVLLLVAVEDFSYEEAAGILGIPLGTVMSRLSRARNDLRQAMAKGEVVKLRSVT